MVVNECNVAQEKDDIRGLDSYAKDVECNSQEENQALIKELTAFSKVMSQGYQS